jgi:guanylate kinase
LIKKLGNFIKSVGNIIVISAPSGAGKSSICNEIIFDRNIQYSISYTTRIKRKGEKNGKEYFFINTKTFKKMIEKYEFIEWAKVHGNYYGTSKTFLDETLKSGKDVLLEVDVQGGVSIKRQYPRACMIFIMPPNLKTLEERLIARNKDCKTTIKIRMKNAMKEFKYIKKYEYLVVNKELDNAVDAVRVIIKSLTYKI